MSLKIFVISMVFTGACIAAGGIEGAWEGELDFGIVKHRLIFHIEDGDGGYVSTMDCPAENVKGLKVYKTSYENNVLMLQIEKSGKFYRGRVNSDGSKFEGRMKTSRGYMPLVLKRAGSDVMRRPQEPVGPLSYIEEEVVFENLGAGVKLAGTVTRPKESGKFPVVILISGSGGHDRNSSMMGHRPFLVLADHLTRDGVAVLRFDDRGIGSSTGDFSKATTEDFASDVLAGIEYVKGQQWADVKRIGLIGHSEGALAAAIAAGRSEDVSFIVMMAGMGVSGDETLIEQTRASAKAAGVGGYIIESNLALQRKIFSVLKNANSMEECREKVHEVYMEQLKAIGNLSEEQLAGAKAQIAEQVEQVTSSWFLHFVNYDPRVDLMKVKCPALVLFGDKDVQVPPGVHEPAVQEAFEAGGNHEYRIKVFEGLNHLFQTAGTGLESEYSKISETISPMVLETISRWILVQDGMRGNNGI